LRDHLALAVTFVGAFPIPLCTVREDDNNVRLTTKANRNCA